MSQNQQSIKILVAPLNWGLGHASRCIPIINALIDQGFQPVLASDGAALELLRREFPSLERHELPSYRIRYSAHPRWMPLKLLSQVPRARTVARKENEMVQALVEREDIRGIISDNRFGVRSDKIPSVYISHQLSVLSGITTPLTSEIHARIIRRFDQCWVCDLPGEDSLSGSLSDSAAIDNLRYIGPLSRFGQGGKRDEKGSNLDEKDGKLDKKGSKQDEDIDICFVLSGPEPQREHFQRRIESVFAGRTGKIVLVEGLVDGKVTKRVKGNMTIFNYLLTEDLESLIERSRLVVARSGYSTIMDLHAMGARAFFVPTPGQGEQEYLADLLEKKGLAGFSEQAEFSHLSLEKAYEYKGFEKRKTSNKNQFHGLFDAFK